MISKSDIVELECNPVPIEVDSFVGQIVNEVGQNFPTHEFQLLIKGECTSVSLDPHLMRKSIGNIISNAAKYSPQGSLVRVEVDCAQEEIVFMVTDEGIGIPADDLDRIFDLFHRGKNVGEIVGTGLGMAIVKRSVEAHSGTVSIRSRLHQGTSVTFRIPQ
jgi:signal transduction histidine kinase